MRRAALLTVLAALAMAPALAQDRAQVEGEARDLGKQLRADRSGIVLDQGAPAAVPGYQGSTLPQTGLADDDRALEAQGTSAAATSGEYQVVRNPDRPQFDPATIDLSRGTLVEQSPEAYVGDTTLGGANGNCTPLPPGSGQGSEYLQTCNAGTKVETGEAVCRTPLVMEVKPGSTKYVYTCEDWSTLRPNNAARRCTPFAAPVRNGVCRERSREPTQYEICRQGPTKFCTEPDVEEGDLVTYECDSPAVSRPYRTEVVDQIITERRDEAMCDAATANQTCKLASETCVDPDPSTRTVNGVAVTRACWNWERRYACTRFSQGNDCGELASNPRCVLDHEDCLDDPQQGACQVKDMVYRCKADSTGPAADKAYVCGGDLYCVNGECTEVDREASTEFKDALVAVHSMGDVRDQFDPNSLTLFSGSAEACSHKVFGLSNCCSGKGVPLLTPWLCSASERDLDRKDDKGLCHRVGSYCSSKVLGVCVTKKDSYCCFESKLSRILQEQGKAQIGKGWGTPKSPSCKGFTIAEFQRIDLSRMDFTEVYDEFLEAAKVPDEAQAATEIQQRIQQYYAHPLRTP